MQAIVDRITAVSLKIIIMNVVYMSTFKNRFKFVNFY